PAGIAAQDDGEDARRCLPDRWQIEVDAAGDPVIDHDQCVSYVVSSVASFPVSGEYVEVRMAPFDGSSCRVEITLRDLQDERWVSVRVYLSTGWEFRSTFIPARGDTSFTSRIDEGVWFVGGEVTEGFVPIAFRPDVGTVCGAS
ncbi:MAG TPA: hypothetical protein VD789_03630, partial [Thermomicrobiales bacterium]|nr:hypothetical protein [Thermomicrobiales bacterium]